MNNNIGRLNIIQSGFKNGYLEKAALLEDVAKLWRELDPHVKGIIAGAPLGGIGGYFLSPKKHKLMGTIGGLIGGGAIGGLGGHTIGNIYDYIYPKLSESTEQTTKKQIAEKTPTEEMTLAEALEHGKKQWDAMIRGMQESYKEHLARAGYIAAMKNLGLESTPEWKRSAMKAYKYGKDWHDYLKRKFG